MSKHEIIRTAFGVELRMRRRGGSQLNVSLFKSLLSAHLFSSSSLSLAYISDTKERYWISSDGNRHELWKSGSAIDITAAEAALIVEHIGVELRPQMKVSA